jgi:hypothetical protein
MPESGDLREENVNIAPKNRPPVASQTQTEGRKRTVTPVLV